MISPNNQYLFHDGPDGPKLWDLNSGQSIPTKGNLPSHIQFSADSHFLFFFQGGTALYNLQTQRWLNFDQWSDSGAFSPDHKLVAIGQSVTGIDSPLGLRSSKILIFDAQTGKLLLEIPLKSEMILGLAFSPDGTKLAAVALDDTVRIWAISWDF